MGPNNISAKSVSMPAAELPKPEQSNVGKTIMNGALKINYGDEAKVNRLALALKNVKSSQNVALVHVESAKSKIDMQ